MRKAKRGRKALVANEALAVLVHLASAAQAYVAAAAAESGEGKTFAVYALRDGQAEKLAPVSRAALAHCFKQGWLAPDQSRARFSTTSAGLHALRAGRNRTAGADPARGSRLGKPQGSEDALGWLRTRRLVSDVQFRAGEKLAADFWHGQLSARVTSNWSGAASGGRQRRSAPGVGVDVRDAVIAARGRFQRALDAVGPELAGILVNVCCEDMGLEAAGKAAGWPQRAAKVVLDLALTRLARHYGMIAPDRPLGVHLRHWGDADYRPTIDVWR